jgi:hypothetical protein
MFQTPPENSAAVLRRKNCCWEPEFMREAVQSAMKPPDA